VVSFPENVTEQMSGVLEAMIRSSVTFFVVTANEPLWFTASWDVGAERVKPGSLPVPFLPSPQPAKTKTRGIIKMRVFLDLFIAARFQRS